MSISYKNTQTRSKKLKLNFTITKDNDVRVGVNKNVDFELLNDLVNFIISNDTVKNSKFTLRGSPNPNGGLLVLCTNDKPRIKLVKIDCSEYLDGIVFHDYELKRCF